MSAKIILYTAHPRATIPHPQAVLFAKAAIVMDWLGFLAAITPTGAWYAMGIVIQIIALGMLIAINRIEI